MNVLDISSIQATWKQAQSFLQTVNKALSIAMYVIVVSSVVFYGSFTFIFRNPTTEKKVYRSVGRGAMDTHPSDGMGDYEESKHTSAQTCVIRHCSKTLYM